MGLFYLVVAKKINTNPNQVFEIHPSDDFNDDKMRFYDQTPREEYEFDIINKIKNGADYRTKNSNGTYTKCDYGIRNEVEYLRSIPNNTLFDNIQKLPTYI